MWAEAKSDFFLSKRSKNNFISIQKLNCKNIFAVFGKSINFLYNKFLFAKSVYLFKCLYKYLSIGNNGSNGLLFKNKS